MARNAQKEFLIGQCSRSHATSPTISGWLLVNIFGLLAFYPAPQYTDSFRRQQKTITDTLNRLGLLCGEPSVKWHNTNNSVISP